MMMMMMMMNFHLLVANSAYKIRHCVFVARCRFSNKLARNFINCLKYPYYLHTSTLFFNLHNIRGTYQ